MFYILTRLSHFSAGDLDRAADRFLRKWDFVSHANMPAFANRTAQWMKLPPPPRYAADFLLAHGIRIRRETMPRGVWALWTIEDGHYLVRISSFLEPAAANFTLWHEWFDILAARPAFPGSPVGAYAERLADRYAACLTMPEGTLRESVATFRGRGDKTDVLASRFGVSRAAMRRRLRELNLASHLWEAR